MDTGKLKISVQSTAGIKPVEGAKITLRSTGNPTKILETSITDNSGRTEFPELTTPPLEYSMQPEMSQPYSLYTIEVESEGYGNVTINGIEVMPDETSLQTVQMRPVESGGSEQNIVMISPLHLPRLTIISGAGDGMCLKVFPLWWMRFLVCIFRAPT